MTARRYPEQNDVAAFADGIEVFRRRRRKSIARLNLQEFRQKAYRVRVLDTPHDSDGVVIGPVELEIPVLEFQVRAKDGD